ncbi:MAG: gamma-glutamyltransferase family protein [Spirochaetota bacterium]
MRRLLAILLRTSLVVIIIASLLAIAYAVLPKGPREPLGWDDPTGSPREPVRASEYAVVTGTPWATEAAEKVLEDGGNAFDAAVAALLMLNVTAGEAASFPGIAPTLVYDAARDEVLSYIGAGVAPEAATIERFRRDGHETIPDLDILAQLLPASPDVMVRLLADLGTMSFEDVSTRAIERAREGFPVTVTMQKNLEFSLLERIGFSVLLPYNARVYLKGEFWRPIHRGDRFTRPDLAATWESLVSTERRALDRGATRSEALLAVRTEFYEGGPARAILELHERRGGLFSSGDLAGYRGAWEAPYRALWTPSQSRLAAGRHEYEVFTNTGWTQGVVVPLALNILEGVDLTTLGHNSADYVHTVVQALELAFADREAYVGDPDFVDVPIETLLSDAYATSRRAATTFEGFRGLPEAGEIPGYDPWMAGSRIDAGNGIMGLGEIEIAAGRDTSQLVVVDRDGNMVAITPSDFPKSPMVPETGMTLGNRMVQFRLDPASPTSLAPGKRPRVTPHAVIVHRDGAPWLAFNTPGGDMQAQALVQVLLNVTVFGMDLQAAIDSPRFRSMSVPSSFAPHEAEPGVLRLEEPLHRRVGIELAARAYEVVLEDRWSNDFGAVGAIVTEDGLLTAAADPREATWAGGR